MLCSRKGLLNSPVLLDACPAPVPGGLSPANLLPAVLLGLPAAWDAPGHSGTSAAFPQVSKYAVRGMTAQVAAELGEFGIRANCVAPGAVDTVGYVTACSALVSGLGSA